MAYLNNIDTENVLQTILTLLCLFYEDDGASLIEMIVVPSYASFV